MASRERERQQFRTLVNEALDDEDDPLAIYDKFVQWTLKSYSLDDPTSGLVELLKEVTSKFKNDPTYRGDLRYLKLWSLYAKKVDRPEAVRIYGFLMKKEIGIMYSVLYEEYADVLEKDGR